MHIELDTTIDRPVEDVFERLTRISEYSRWLPPSLVFTTCRQTSGGAVGLGTKYEDTTKMGTLEGEVDDFVPSSRVGFHETLRWGGRAVLDARMSYELRTDDAGRTHVHHVAEGEPRGALGPAAPILQLVAGHERRRTLEALKRSLEAPEQHARARS